jgi:hypothetical protein
MQFSSNPLPREKTLRTAEAMYDAFPKLFSLPVVREGFVAVDRDYGGRGGPLIDNYS